MIRTAASKKKILVVDDDTASQEILGDLLQQDGYQVVAAANGYEALEALRFGLRPVCVVLDMRMPLMTGWEFLDAVEGAPDLRSIPIIGVTGGPRRAADESRFRELLPKPLDLNDLRAAVERCAASPG